MRKEPGLERERRKNSSEELETLEGDEEEERGKGFLGWREEGKEVWVEQLMAVGEANIPNAIVVPNFLVYFLSPPLSLFSRE
ncbi:hypothetical protein TIFTF001_020241 [Ficus carica]|uniref:Uncharacterized protein n=1 Tax=Ficus carica TaxID=3494 RepID=A0AA88AF58_FICCA|nr:hypothetical protein TIFTF001_020241 [Ficus carica]